MCERHSEYGNGPVHPTSTKRSSLCYHFYNKHHKGDPQYAQWVDLTFEEEFEIFDSSDHHEIRCENNHLYGIRKRNAEASIPSLGTMGEIVAKFPKAADGLPWHGFPSWPLAKLKSEGGRDYQFPKEAIELMFDSRLINKVERKRLRKGDGI